VIYFKDVFFKRAKKEGYFARSVYKLEEIDKKYRLFKKGYKVLDLGSSPGSWLQYIAKKVGEKGIVVGVDINPLKWETPPSYVYFWQRDVLNWDFKEIKNLVPFNVVVSDMAPLTTGIKDADVYRCFKLADKALEIAKMFLAPKGHFVTKVFEGQEVKQLLMDIKNYFSFIKVFKPKGSRAESREIFIICLNRR